jgi:hypothetical protein
MGAFGPFGPERYLVIDDPPDQVPDGLRSPPAEVVVVRSVHSRQGQTFVHIPHRRWTPPGRPQPVLPTQ